VSVCVYIYIHTRTNVFKYGYDVNIRKYVNVRIHICVYTGKGIHGRHVWCHRRMYIYIFTCIHMIFRYEFVYI